MLPFVLSLTKGRQQSRLRTSYKVHITFELLRNAWYDARVKQYDGA
jgi:hypothetical protein